MTLVHLAERQAEKPPLPEVGRPGTQFMHGFLQTEEYVPELVGTRGLQTYEKMRRSDGMVAATLRGIKLPLLSATWEIQAASDSPEDEAIADQLRYDLFEGMSLTWAEHLRQVLTYLDLGFYVCEIVWDAERTRLQDGSPHYGLRKLAPRLQRTIAEWVIEDDGGLSGVKQAVWSKSSFRTETIGIDKILVFTNEKEGANWSGKSVLRPAYKHWYIKDQLYRIDAIAAERHGVGIADIGLPENADDAASLARAEEIGAAVRAHEKGYIARPFGWTFDLKGMDGRGVNLLPMIQHHDRMIAVSVLAQFLTLGEHAEGSYALSEDQSSLFMMVERAVGEYVCDIHNRFLIPKWTRYNYGLLPKQPRLIVHSIETRNAESLIKALADGVMAGLITSDLALENAIRQLANLPLLEESSEPEPGTEPVVDDEALRAALGRLFRDVARETYRRRRPQKVTP